MKYTNEMIEGIRRARLRAARADYDFDKYRDRQNAPAWGFAPTDIPSKYGNRIDHGPIFESETPGPSNLDRSLFIYMTSPSFPVPIT